jgi:hypothetical protein
MNRSIRCRHGFDRDLVPCYECGDPDWLNVAQDRHTENTRRIRAARAARRAVISNPHGRPSDKRDARGLE